MSRSDDSRAAGTSSWVDRVRKQERAIPPTVKTDDTPVDANVRTAPPTAKTDETPPTGRITSVLTVTPPVRVETQHVDSAGEPSPRTSVNRGMVMTVGHYHGYPLLPLKPGVSIAEG